MTSKQLIEMLRDIGQQPRRYSGRGMYGEVCVGVELENIAEAFTVGATLSEDANRRDRYDLSCMPVEWDALGTGVILYFPCQRWPKDMREEEDD